MEQISQSGIRKISVLYQQEKNNEKQLEEQKEEKIELRVAAYCRVSSGSEEQMASLKTQMKYYETLLNTNTDYKYAGIYADEGISGTDMKKREAFNQMMEDCKAGLIDMIITKSVSRFGRNTLDCLNCVRELKKLGIDVYFEKEGIHTLRSEGEVLLTLVSAICQSESAAQSENVKWGIRRRYEQGNVKSIPSGKFLGYDKDEQGNLVIDKIEAKIVRRIYKEFLDGYGTYQIAARLTEENVPMTFGGKEWCASHISKVLKNEKYKGDTLFQKTYNIDYLTKKRARNNGELPQYYIEDTHTAIIDKDTWECVQLEFERQKKYCIDHKISTYHRSNPENPLSAKIICSVCGSTFVLLESKRLGEEGRKYWRCRSFRGDNGKEVKGRVFIPKPMYRFSQNPEMIRRRKDPLPRQMLCTDVQVEEGMPEKAYIKAWNRLVERYEEYLPVWEAEIEGDDLLKAYRTKEMMNLIEEYGDIDGILYELMLKTLDHIKVSTNGPVKVIFLAGISIEIDINSL